MVNSGTGHDRCPSGFPEPIRRPRATLRWRLRNYKNRFWFQEGALNFFVPEWTASPAWAAGTLTGDSICLGLARPRGRPRSQGALHSSMAIEAVCGRKLL